MRLLTIGVGIRGAKIAELLAKKGTRVNRVPLFKSFAVLNDERAIRSVSLPESRKFYVLNDVSGVVAAATATYEITEGSLVVTSLEDDFGFSASLEICERLKEVTEDYVLSIAILPQLEMAKIVELRERIRELRKKSDVMFLFRGTPETEQSILKTFNLIALAGEIDLKKRVAGEVVIDTSDVFNALRGDGFSVVGYAERTVPLMSFLKSKSELKAARTRRMLEMVDDAMKNVSVDSEIGDASSALLLYAANPKEVTMEGLFAAISKIEQLNNRIVVRYGDYPLLRSRKVSLVLLFSGIRKLKVS